MLVINEKCTTLLFVFPISWCPLLQCLGDQLPKWPSHLTWHDRVPLLQVSPCVANQNMTSYETDNDMYIQDITDLVRNVHCAFSLLHLSYTSLNSFSCFDLMWRFRLLLYSQLYSHWGHFSLLLLLESLLVLSLEILVIFLVEMSMPFSITIEC